MHITQRITYWIQLMRLDKPIGILLLLWPTLWALWLAAEGIPDPEILVIFILGVIIMRSAGCVINDFADRKIDGRVQRTKNRPLATGKISSKEALSVFVVLLFLALLLVLMLNALTIALAFVALFFASLYPFMKRYTHMPQLFLGLAFSMAIPMAFAAQQNSVPILAGWLFLANVLWTIAYDTLYAMVDREDDVQIGVKSSAILFGHNDTRIIALLAFMVLVILGYIGIQEELGLPWFFGLLIAAGLFARQQYLVRHRERQACFQAFLDNHYIGLVIFLGLFLQYQL